MRRLTDAKGRSPQTIDVASPTEAPTNIIRKSLTSSTKPPTTIQVPLLLPEQKEIPLPTPTVPTPPRRRGADEGVASE